MLERRILLLFRLSNTCASYMRIVFSLDNSKKYHVGVFTPYGFKFDKRMDLCKK